LIVNKGLWANFNVVVRTSRGLEDVTEYAQRSNSPFSRGGVKSYSSLFKGRREGLLLPLFKGEIERGLLFLRKNPTKSDRYKIVNKINNI